MRVAWRCYSFDSMQHVHAIVLLLHRMLCNLP